MFHRRRGFSFFAVCWALRASSTGAATLTVQPLALSPGEVATVIVEGSVANESTFGVTILVELVPRTGAQGSVTFTPAPPSDIGLAGTPWLSTGTFTPFDTDVSGSPTLNASVTDNGKFVPELVTYDGLLAGYPVVASAGASGTWDVLLSTSVGDSGWEGLGTTLEPGTVSVTSPLGIPAASGWSILILGLSVATFGTILQARRAQRLVTRHVTGSRRLT